MTEDDPRHDPPDGLAAMFKALGDPTRLRIFDYLRSCAGPVVVETSGEVRTVTGPTVGDVCCRINGSTRAVWAISFHLKELRQAGLISITRQGKHMVCRANPEAAAALVEFLDPSCAGGLKDNRGPVDAG